MSASTKPYFARGLLLDEVNRCRARDGEPPLTVADLAGPTSLPPHWRHQLEARYATAYLLAAWGFVTEAKPKEWAPEWGKPIPLSPQERRALRVLRGLILVGSLRPPAVA